VNACMLGIGLAKKSKTLSDILGAMPRPVFGYISCAQLAYRVARGDLTVQSG